MDPHSLDRLTKELALRKRLQEALLVFSRGVSARLGLAGALESLTRDVNTLFGARRCSVWMHDRRARVMTLTAASDPREPETSSVSIDDPSVVGRGLRLQAPELTGQGDAQCLVIPLRGWRRALGTLVMEGEPREADRQLFVELGTDLGLQLSIALERILVLDEFIGDMTEQIQLRGRLAQSEKLAALGQFVAGIAHEINNPLQGVLGYAELMLESVPADSPLRADLGRIYREAERAAEIVRNLLMFTGAQRSPRQPLDLAELVAETIAIREAVSQRVHVDIVQQGDLAGAIVVGDARRLQQALINIMVNAEQAIASSADYGQIVVRIVAAESRVVLELEDSGPGIPANILPKIFDPFFTTKEVGQGTGLGLAIAYGIVHDHGGVISAAASPLGGARFIIELPASGKVESSSSAG